MANPSPTPVSTNNIDWVSRILSILAIALVCIQFWMFRDVPIGPTPNPTPTPTPNPLPSPSTNFAAIGRVYASQGIASTWGDGMIAAGNAIKSGADITAVQTAMEAAWTKSRIAKFDEIVTPELSKISDGINPDAATREKLGQAFIDMGTGAKSVK